MYIYLYLSIYLSICLSICLSIYLHMGCVTHHVLPPPPLLTERRCYFGLLERGCDAVRSLGHLRLLGAHGALAFTRYCHCQYCMVYGITQAGSGGGRILPNSRAIVLHQCGQCRRAGRMRGRGEPEGHLRLLGTHGALAFTYYRFYI